MTKSMMLVVPPAMAADVPVKKSSLVMVPMKGISIWVCGSIPPGITNMPPASTISVPVGASKLGSTATITPSSHNTSARVVCSAVTTVPPRTSSFMRNLLPIMFRGRRCP